MLQFHRILNALRKGPHGNVAAAAALSAALALAFLFSGLMDVGLWPPAVAASIGALLVGQTLGIVILNRVRAKLNDVHYAVSLEHGLRRAGYEIGELFTDGAAANPSLQLLNLKILRLCQPKNVLEIGSGQTTKLLSCYARSNPSVSVLSLEQDGGWVARLKVHVVHDYRHVPLERKQFTCPGSNLRLTTIWHREVPELRSRRFDYILIDGPDPGTVGTVETSYARSGILEYMPSILAESFVVVFDDTDRYGEMMTVRAFETQLRAFGVQHVRFDVHGVKTQSVFCSPDRSFLRSS